MRTAKIMLAVLFCATLARAETLEGLSRRINDVVQGKDNGNQIQDLRVQGDAVIGDDLAVSGDLSVSGAQTVSGTLSGANVSTTGKVTGSVFGGGSFTGGTVTASGAVSGSTLTGSGRIASQSGSSGEFRVGYLTSYGWLFNTTGGGQTLQFMADYATTGGVAKASLTDAGLFSAGSLTVPGTVTIGGNALIYRTLTNLVYDGGATTGNVNIVSW
jgi:hypothetical protein